MLIFKKDVKRKMSLFWILEFMGGDQNLKEGDTIYPWCANEYLMMA